MRYTLELKDKQVKESELEAEAEKVRREKQAEAAGNEQIIAAKAQEEAMKHVLPFKQKQIEQRQLEADSRRKLAEADAYRLEIIGKASSEQLARDGALISQNPLLIQKTLADKLSDKISVIIAPPPASGGFIASGLLGAGMPAAGRPGPPAYPGARPISTSESSESDQ